MSVYKNWYRKNLSAMLTKLAQKPQSEILFMQLEESSD